MVTLNIDKHWLCIRIGNFTRNSMNRSREIDMESKRNVYLYELRLLYKRSLYILFHEDYLSNV